MQGGLPRPWSKTRLTERGKLQHSIHITTPHLLPHPLMYLFFLITYLFHLHNGQTWNSLDAKDLAWSCDLG